MRVLISGGGIAGLTLAYWLHRYGISAVVVEQAASIRRDGYGLDFLARREVRLLDGAEAFAGI